MTPPWLHEVRGSQVLPLINLDSKIIRVEAGPGTGKTFGLVRRVQRILHPEGLNVPGKDVLVVAFNRVIAQQLTEDIDRLLEKSPHDGVPTIKTVHALCLGVIKAPLRILLPHEREAMLYDVRTAQPDAVAEFDKIDKIEQALALHEAKHANYPKLWQAVREWLDRHKAQLISDLPSLLLDSLKAGDFSTMSYAHVIVDEYQDLTAGEQALFMRLRRKGGSLLALGDPRQSIYAFRGNELTGLAKIEKHLEDTSLKVTDVEMSECQRCPEDIVKAANRLMSLYKAAEMVSTSKAKAETHVVYWNTPLQEAMGMAKVIVRALKKYPKDKHLVMVTRRKWGYMLRDEIAKVAPELNIELNFSESLLETWSVREAFLFFCLLVDPDGPTWRAWLGYQDAPTGKGFNATERNSAAYLALLAACDDDITTSHIEAVAASDTKPKGKHGATLWRRAQRFVALRDQLDWDGADAEKLVERVFADDFWISDKTEDATTARLDMGICRTKAFAILKDVAEKGSKGSVRHWLKAVATTLRYQIATREPFVKEAVSDAQIATLWGAKGITADHVFIIGLCDQAIPGTRRDEYPGTDAEYIDEQRRLFYVSITRSKRTLVLSRATKIAREEARDMGLLKGDAPYWMPLKMSQFLRSIIEFLPDAQAGEEWVDKFIS